MGDVSGGAKRRRGDEEKKTRKQPKDSENTKYSCTEEAMREKKVHKSGVTSNGKRGEREKMKKKYQQKSRPKEAEKKSLKHREEILNEMDR